MVAPFRFIGLAAVAMTASSWGFDAGQLDKLALAQMKADKMPSISIAVSKNGKVIYAKAFGKSNLELDTSASPDTLYEIGSVTKQFTAALALQAIEEGKMKIDDPISLYVDGTPETWKGVTVRHCLTHTSGIPDYLGIGFNPRKDYSPKEILELVNKQKLDYEPGSAWSYTNTGFHLLGMAVEKLYKKEYAVLLKERIFDKAGMASSRGMSLLDVIKNRADGYNVGDKSTRNTEALRANSAWAAGMILSTPTDLLKWDHALLAGKILKPDLVDEMFAPVTFRSGRKFPYGYGWFLHTDFGEKRIEHGGNTFGQTASNTILREHGIYIAMLSNKAGASFGSLDREIAKMIDPGTVRARPEPKPDPNPELTKRVRDAVNAFLDKGAKPEYCSEEFIGNFSTLRGKTSRAGLQTGHKRLLRLTYLDEEAMPRGKRLRYIARSQNVAAWRVVIEIDGEGKLVRIGSDGW